MLWYAKSSWLMAPHLPSTNKPRVRIRKYGFQNKDYGKAEGIKSYWNASATDNAAHKHYIEVYKKSAKGSLEAAGTGQDHRMKEQSQWEKSVYLIN